MQSVDAATNRLHTASMKQEPADRARRSECPINLTIELLGDRWSFIVLRDIMFGGRRRYRELLENSEEGIASNILADRLKKLTRAGLLTRAAVASHKQKAIYSLTEQAITLVPLFVQLGAWGRRWLKPSAQFAVRAKLLEDGGPRLWARFEADLRTEHLGAPRRRKGPTVAEELRAAFEQLQD
jgi:DNA-binding HxlR family transcriptional regulator